MLPGCLICPGIPRNGQNFIYKNIIKKKTRNQGVYKNHDNYANVTQAKGACGKTFNGLIS